MKGMWKLITEAWRYRSVSENYVYMNLGLKYRRNVLGYLWSLLFPMLRYGIMALVFSYALKSRDPHYFGHFFVGMIVFSFISSSIGAGTRSMLSNATYIKKLYVPKLLFVVNPVIYEWFNTLLVLLGLAILGWVFGLWQPHWSQLLIFPSFVLIILFVIGLGTLLGLSMVWFNDTQYLVDLTLATLMFITPIMFLPSQLPDWLWMYNPFYYFVELVRGPLVDQAFPSWQTWAVTGTLAVLTFLFGLFLLAKKQDKIIFRL